MNHNPFRPTTPPSAKLLPWVLPQPAWVVTPQTVESLAADFAPISLSQMDAVALLDRVDTKFVLTTAQLLTALAQIQPDYWMLSVDGQRLNRYRTLYFDTPDFALYHAHVNERPDRYKVRSREYVDSHLAFLEVKHRTRKARTIKDRIPTVGQVLLMTPEMEGWLRQVSPLAGLTLEPKLCNTFTRLTLVNQQCPERLTFDIDLNFSFDGKTASLGGLAIAEVKTDTCYNDSPFMAQMRAQKIRPNGFSKYATGVALLYDHVKKNALKAKLLWLEKMTKAYYHEVKSFPVGQ